MGMAIAANYPLFATALLSVFSLLSSTTIASSASSGLSVDYYAKTCPRFQDIMHNVLVPKQISNPTTAAATLRIFVHDCLVEGCDASVLLNSRPNGNKTEKDSDINESLAGDGFEVLLHAKTALEIACPGVVSCSDILAFATRNLVKQVGGPYYEVLLGRKDSRDSSVSSVESNLVRSNASIDEMIQKFEAKGFNATEMVALTVGGHTIGFAHCKEFASRIFGPIPDPTLHPKLAERLRTMCANYEKEPDMSAFLDPISPGNFDNMVFKNLLKGLGVLQTDQRMALDPRTRPAVERYARDPMAFFGDFAKAMEKVSVLGVKTGDQGEVRHRCDAVNAAAGAR